LKRVGESCCISVSVAISEVSALPWLASALAFDGSLHSSAPFSTSVEPMRFAVSSAPANGSISCASGSSGSGAGLRFGGSNGIAGGPCSDASVIESITRTSAMPSA
jgi:hypothetical protein